MGQDEHRINQIQQEKPPLLILTGPTAAGKTALSVALAKAVGGEIISADSMQVYRQMDIGSAKVTEAEMQGVPHHLIDVLEPEEEFNVVRFQQLAKQAAGEIRSRGKLPIVVGGTGFYIQALLYDIDFTQTKEESRLREQLEQLAREKGNGYLHGLLRQADPEAADKIHENNVKRVIRALEYHAQTGQLISAHNEQQRGREAAWRFRYFVLTDDRARLYERIDRRVDRMLEEGLVDEVRALRERGLKKEMVSMRGLGYKEILSYLEGEYDLERAVYLIKRDTRHFAKRQLTWFKRERDVEWIDRQDFSEENAILQYLTGQAEELKR
ncbi:MAG: tRNA (adenosine(37)-N6)-dimethylallyltransferase MiaA [Eubacteriales bacterium]|nr:tRNA (adenosine(37)-N6)-dimethylallyltransferase MiaA [Eubacteriales bacterium]